ncbi:hypothetical protein HAX54_015074 [Datura stramonium]|uniref:Disease resistance protein winged helix domain-containing protein n=1 Tax=Datura stramonium TaxID=4076 RepID=A0ABS8TQR3_DATST|nr:hypothetical protein [Datura stramonium]
MRVLALSYHHLPSHLKLCFLYFAIFPEDKLIFVDKLVELCVVEGFLKVEEMKSTEEVAENCLKELIDRSLISIHRSRFDGKIESCGMHDVIRELCLREAQNMNFVNILGEKGDQNPCGESIHFSSMSRGRISIQLNMSDLIIEKISGRYPNNEIHSIICFRKHWYLPKLPFKLVRVVDLSLISLSAFPSLILDLIHLRYLSLSLYPGLEICRGEEVPSSIDIPQPVSSLCYVQTFILKLSPNEAWKYPFILPLEILTMPQLRHLNLDWNYLRKHELTEKWLGLKNLHSLSGWNPRYCTGSLFRLFPNINKLQICGTPEDFHSHKDLYDFLYLDQLKELEFCLTMERKRQYTGLAPAESLLLPPANAFPQNLKKLSFSQTYLRWKDLSIVSKLPKLEALTLTYDACIGEEWEGVDEGFPRLKFLLLDYLDIRFWRASSDHFPCLERLFLDCCWNLDSISLDFADITTLALIDIRGSQSAWNSAKQIQQDMQDNYASSVELHIRPALKW